MEKHQYDHFFSKVQPVLKSKVEEMQLLGYGTIKEAEIWEFLKRKKWRKVKEDILLHEIVEHILSVKPSEYMTYASVEAMKLTDFSLDNELELKELLK